MMLRQLAVAVATSIGMVTTAIAAPVFTDTTPGLTTFTLAAGTYDIIAGGAGGGNGVFRTTGGLGAIVEGTFVFTVSTQLTILVGGRGATGTSGAGGGGGGTFVVGPGNLPLLIAGGGGGGSNTSSNGGNGQGIMSAGGAGGAGGSAGTLTDAGGGGGGGLTGNGQTGESTTFDIFPVPGGAGGSAFVNGGAGGIAGVTPQSGNGGIGGGGGGGQTGGGGGGGGYTGGAGGLGSTIAASGGTSFDAGTNNLFSLATVLGNGSVTISLIPPAATGVPEPETVALLGVGLAAVLAARRRRKGAAA